MALGGDHFGLDVAAGAGEGLLARFGAGGFLGDLLSVAVAVGRTAGGAAARRGRGVGNGGVRPAGNGAVLAVLVGDGDLAVAGVLDLGILGFNGHVLAGRDALDRAAAGDRTAAAGRPIGNGQCSRNISDLIIVI